MMTPHRATQPSPSAKMIALEGIFFFKGKRQQENLSPAVSRISFRAPFVLYLIFCFKPS